MTTDRPALYNSVLGAAIAAHERIRKQDPTPVFAAVDAILTSLRNGGKVLFFGNGGSAADAQHAAAELVGRYLRERRALAAIALTTDTSILTAIGNDYSFDRVFARQIEALAKKGDVAVAISTSGVSPSVIVGVDTARSAGLTTIGLTGRDGGALGSKVDIHINVPEAETPRAQEVHRTLLHLMCELIERELP